jgi:hypothetical protein
MKIHLHSRQGLYQVERFGRNSIMLSTKHTSFSVPTSDFKSFAGGLWNNQVSKDEMDQFMAVVRPDEYKIQVEQEDQILTLAARLDIIQDAVKAEVIHTNQETSRHDKYDELKDKIKATAREVYKQSLDVSHIKINYNGIKFIIQQHEDETYRFCWDPYQFVDNYHSNISDIYRDNNWYTMNGGWIKIINNSVILYSKSGDYGVYDDAVAIHCAEKLFPNHKIYSFAGREWDSELANMFDELPF